MGHASTQQQQQQQQQQCGRAAVWDSSGRAGGSCHARLVQRAPDAHLCVAPLACVSDRASLPPPRDSPLLSATLLSSPSPRWFASKHPHPRTCSRISQRFASITHSSEDTQSSQKRSKHWNRRNKMDSADMRLSTPPRPGRKHSHKRKCRQRRSVTQQCAFLALLAHLTQSSHSFAPSLSSCSDCARSSQGARRPRARRSRARVRCHRPLDRPPRPFEARPGRSFRGAGTGDGRAGTGHDDQDEPSDSGGPGECIQGSVTANSSTCQERSRIAIDCAHSFSAVLHSLSPTQA